MRREGDATQSMVTRTLKAYRDGMALSNTRRNCRRRFDLCCITRHLSPFAARHSYTRRRLHGLQGAYFSRGVPQTPQCIIPIPTVYLQRRQVAGSLGFQVPERCRIRHNRVRHCSSRNTTGRSQSHLTNADNNHSIWGIAKRRSRPFCKLDSPNECRCRAARFRFGETRLAYRVDHSTARYYHSTSMCISF